MEYSESDGAPGSPMVICVGEGDDEGAGAHEGEHDGDGKDRDAMGGAWIWMQLFSIELLGATQEV